jgi:hypothetical protein
MTKSRLTKVSVNFLPESMNALDEAAEREGISRTDVLNRAAAVYNFISEKKRERVMFLLKASDGKVSEVLFI